MTGSYDPNQEVDISVQKQNDVLRNKNEKIKHEKVQDIIKEAAKLRFYKHKDLQVLAKDHCLRVNGTEKQREQLSKKDFEVYIQVITDISFVRGTQNNKWYYNNFLEQLHKRKIF